jgi:hypothetical protein
LAELDVCLLKLWHSRFLLLTDNYPSQQWLSFWIHRMHAAASWWGKRRTDMAPSLGSMYPI